MVNMKKASAATDASKNTQVDYSTSWDKRTLHDKVRLMREHARVLQSNLVGSEYMPCTPEQEKYYRGMAVGMYFVLDELAEYIDRMSENSEVRYGERDVI